MRSLKVEIATPEGYPDILLPESIAEVLATLKVDNGKFCRVDYLKFAQCRKATDHAIYQDRIVKTNYMSSIRIGVNYQDAMRSQQGREIMPVDYESRPMFGKQWIPDMFPVLLFGEKALSEATTNEERIASLRVKFFGWTAGPDATEEEIKAQVKFGSPVWTLDGKAQDIDDVKDHLVKAAYTSYDRKAPEGSDISHRVPVNMTIGLHNIISVTCSGIDQYPNL